MRLKITMLSAPLALALLMTGMPQANAFVSALIMADRMVQKSTREALATPGHAEWCAQNHPGYRKQWNNYKLDNGRVAWCASPYYSPPWMKWGRAGQ